MSDTVKDLIIRQLLKDRKDGKIIYIDNEPEYRKENLYFEGLYRILVPFDNWFNNAGPEKNNEAKQALYQFYEEFKKLKPSKTYVNGYLHIEYLSHLLRIKEAITEKKYMRVCNELLTLIHDEPFLQGRIYYNIKRILKEGLGLIDNV